MPIGRRLYIYILRANHTAKCKVWQVNRNDDVINHELYNEGSHCMRPRLQSLHGESFIPGGMGRMTVESMAPTRKAQIAEVRVK